MWGVLAPLLLAAQVTVQAPGMKVPERRVTHHVELRDIAQGEHDRVNVATRGYLARLEEPYFALEQGTERVMVIPMPGSSAALEALLGREIEVEGFVRRLYDRQGICLQEKPQSYCDDPDLPTTPNRAGRPDWPRLSITVWSAVERDAGETARPADRGSLAELLDGTEAGAPVTVHGRFCGVSLCGSPATPAPERGAWRITDGDVSIWVVGKEPRGKGWRLDPAHAADASRWVEVTGKVVACGTTRCLRASKVGLAPAPRPSDEP
jgi:hypothetical protein